MSTPKQLLQVDPENELLFKGPFHLPSAAFMRLTNVTDKRVLFKIKTTVPKKYCVRPNSGVLYPSKYIDIVLSLQPFSYDPLEINKHKFLVQSTQAPYDDDVNMEEVWRTIEADKIIENKLRCIFEVPQGAKVHSQVNTNPVVIKTPNNTASYCEAPQELQHLKEEQLHIKEENIRLKEEILQLKNNIEATSTPPPSTVSVKEESRVPSLALVFSGMFLGVIGFLLGKYGF